MQIHSRAKNFQYYVYRPKFLLANVEYILCIVGGIGRQLLQDTHIVDKHAIIEFNLLALLQIEIRNLN